MEFWRSPLAGSKPQSMGAQYLFIPQANHPQHPKCKGDRFWGIILALLVLVGKMCLDVSTNSMRSFADGWSFTFTRVVPLHMDLRHVGVAQA